MRTWRGGWLGLLGLAAGACGSSSGAPFTPATPVADACGLLALADVQMLVTGAPAGTPLNLSDNAEVWLRGCAWQASPMALTLIVEGALTSPGNVVLESNVDVTSDSTRQATPVSGVGDKAVYLVNQGLGQILNAKRGNVLVSLSASGFTPDVPEASLQPLAVEALGQL
jgi:hypothetical protein